MTEEKQIKCPSCGYPIGKTAKECPSCGIAFQSDKKVSVELKKESGGLIILMTVSDSIEAQMIRMFLEEEKIPCVVGEGGVTSVLGASSLFPFFEVRILVPADRARDALIAMQKYHKWDEKELERYLTMLDETE